MNSQIVKDLFRCFRQAFKSTSLLALLSTGLRISGGLIALPIALRTIPQSELGLYYTFLSISAIVVLFDLGFASAVSRNASYAMAGAESVAAHGVPKFSGKNEPNRQLMAALVEAIRRWYALVGVVVATALLSFGTWFIYLQIKESGLNEVLLGAWILFAGANVLSFSTGFWSNLLIGSGGVRGAVKLGLWVQAGGLLVLVVALMVGWGIWSYGVSLMVVAILNRLFTKQLFIRTTGVESGRSFSIPVTKVLRDLWPMAWRQGAVSLGAFLIQRGNILICSSKLGLEETGSYGLSLSLVTIILQLATVPVFVVMPKISSLRVHKNSREIWRVFSLRLYGGLAAGVFGIITIALWGGTLLAFIGSKSQLLPTSTLLLLGMVMLLEQHHSQYGSLVLTENRNPFIAPALISGLAIFTLSWFTVSQWGVFGLIVSQGVVQLCWNNWWTVKQGMKGLSENP